MDKQLKCGRFWLSYFRVCSEDLQHSISATLLSLQLTVMPLLCEALSLFCHHGVQELTLYFQVLLGKEDQLFYSLKDQIPFVLIWALHLKEEGNCNSWDVVRSHQVFLILPATQLHCTALGGWSVLVLQWIWGEYFCSSHSCFTTLSVNIIYKIFDGQL